MALIFALIIFAVLIGRSVREKVGHKQYERERDDFKRNLDVNQNGFDKYIASRQKTDDVRKVAFLDKVQYEQQCPPNEETIQARRLRKRIWEEVHIQPTPEMLTCAILAQEGLVPIEMSWSAYNTSRVSPLVEFGRVEQDFLKWLDKELQKHNMSFKMRWVSRDDRTSLGFGRDETVSQPVELTNTSRMGVYYWTDRQARSGKRYLIVKPYDYQAPYIEYQNIAV